MTKEKYLSGQCANGKIEVHWWKERSMSPYKMDEVKELDNRWSRLNGKRQPNALKDNVVGLELENQTEVKEEKKWLTSARKSR